jgi:hypothetical protein
MSPPPNAPSEIFNQLAEFAAKVLKPGGVSIGGLYGLWALFVQEEVATAIAAALIGFCFSYLGYLLTPLHQGNQKRLTTLGEALNTGVDDTLQTLLANATGAEEAYLLCQALDCRDYKPEGMGARDRVQIPLLQDVYVPLELDMSAIAPGFSHPKFLRSTPDGEPPELYIWDFLAAAAKEPSYRQLAIIAWGGYGKTTLLKHLAYIHGSRQHDQYGVPFRVPILLPLRTYRKELTTDSPHSLPSLIMQHHVSGLSALDKRVANLPENWAETRLRDGKALVMFDGFDEIPEAERPALSRWIQTQMRSFDLSVFILASRPRAYAEDFTDSLRTKIWVRPFTPKQQARFVTDWYRCQERLSRGGRSSPEVEQEAERNAHNLIAQIQDPQRTELADLAKNPLLLNLLATFHRSDPSLQLPRQRAELYQDICTLQLRKRPDARNIPLLLTAEERQTVLQAVALSLMESTLKLMPEADWLDRVGEVLTEQGHTGISAQTFLNQIIDVSELVVRQGREGCEFAHLSFQEFLAAKQIKDLKQEARLYPHLQSANQSGGGDEEAWWRQTILLYAAQTNPAPLIQEALRQGATDLAYACYQETQRTLDPAIVAELEALRPTLRTFRYARLEELLRTGNWREADQETYRLMITTVGKEEGQWFDPEDLLNFPCEDLKAIDGLWVKYSQGKFGFSVQKQIYVECGAKVDGQYPGDEIWDKFCDRVGWRKGGEDLIDLQANLSLSPTGEFPVCCGWLRCVGVFSRIETCKL